MSHHSIDQSLTTIVGGYPKEELRTLTDTLFNPAALPQPVETLGPTKDFPHGKLVPHDEGGLIFGVTVFNGRVVFDFGKPIRSIGFTREGALELAELLKQRAEQCPAIIRKVAP